MLRQIDIVNLKRVRIRTVGEQAFCFGMWIEDFAFPVGATIGIFMGIWSVKFWG